MKKIAIISYGGLPLPPVKGGAVENLIHFLVQNNEEKKIAELTVFSSYDKNAFEESHKYKNTKFVYINNHKIADAVTGFTNRIFRKLRFGASFQVFPYLFDIVNIIKKSDFDYVIVENKAEYTPYLKRKLRIPIILHMHNDYLNSKYYLANAVMNSCTKIIAVSDYVKNCILTIKNDAENIVVLRNVIDVKNFMSDAPNARNRLRAEYGIKDSDIVFAFVGRLTPGKGVAELINAFSRLLEKHDNIKLLVIGAQWFSMNTNSKFTKQLQLSSMPIRDKIIFTGYVDYACIAEQYACADVVVVPSIVGEACGLVVLEAMAAGKALIISNSGGIPEHVNQECAIEVPLGEDFINGLETAMDKLISNSDIIEKMSEQGRHRALTYDKDDYLKHLVEHLTRE